jgi:FKBP-type peptidyl-prolyl cis-trans isomerase
VAPLPDWSSPERRLRPAGRVAAVRAGTPGSLRIPPLSPKAASVRLRAVSALVTLSASLAGGLATAAVVAAPAGAASSLDAVTVSTDTTAKPTVEFDKPFAVKKSANSVVAPGAGDELAKGQTVKIDYVVIDARTGKEVESSYGKATLPLVLDKKQTLKPLVAALTGKTVGSRVLLAVAPKDGVAAKLAAAKVKKNDTLLFVIDARETRATRASGEAVAPVDGLPTVKLAADGKPTITVPKGATAPTSLVVQPLVKGTGPVVQAGQTISVHYTGVVWDTGKQFDSSWDRGQTADFVIGNGQVIAGWDEGLVGQTVGSQSLLVVPPDKGYGTQGQASAGIKGTDTLVFVVDILDAT